MQTKFEDQHDEAPTKQIGQALFRRGVVVRHEAKSHYIQTVYDGIKEEPAPVWLRYRSGSEHDAERKIERGHGQCDQVAHLRQQLGGNRCNQTQAGTQKP